MPSWLRIPFDIDLLTEHVIPSWAALEAGWSPAALVAVRALAAALRSRDPEEAAHVRSLHPEFLRSGASLARATEEFAGDPLAPVLALSVATPEDLRALLLMLAWHRFEPGRPRADLAGRVLRGASMAGMDSTDECLYALCPLIDACERGPIESSGAPPAGNAQLGAMLALDGDDWREVEPFCGTVVRGDGGWLYLPAA